MDIMTPVMSIGMGFAKALVIFAIAMPILVAAGIAIWIMPYYQTSWEVRMFTQGGIQIRKDNGKIINKDGVITYKLLKNKVELPPPKDSNCVMRDGKKLHFKIARHPNGMWEYIQYMPNLAKDYELNTLSIKWIEQRIKEKRAKYLEPNWWDANKGWLIPAGGLVLVTILMIVFIKFNADTTQTAMSMSGHAVDVMERFTNAFGTTKMIPTNTTFMAP